MAIPRLGIAVLLWTLLVSQASAQSAPLVTPRDLRPEAPDVPPVTLPQAAPAQAPAAADSLFVELGDVALAGGFEEFAAATEALIAPLRGRRTSVAEFYALAAAIEELYLASGYLLVRIEVPPQSLGDGETLQLHLVDGFIERIDLDGVPARARRWSASWGR